MHKPLAALYPFFNFQAQEFSEERFIAAVKNNLSCLSRIIDFNLKHGLLFLRISSDIIPFASHPVCDLNWQLIFKKELTSIGKKIRNGSMRISMHPDQFVVINSRRLDVVKNSLRELEFHADLLDSLDLDSSAKIQIHVGGVYSSKKQSIARFIKVYSNLEHKIKDRLVIENDDRNYTLEDCLYISAETNIPVLFDFFHNKLNNTGNASYGDIEITALTWTEADGTAMADYSSQEKGEKPGKHTASIEINDFRRLVKETASTEYDLMLEIKDKEISALKALNLINSIKKE